MMIIYNVTLRVEKEIEADWIVWMREHIPQVLGTGLFASALFTKILGEQDEGAQAYSVQYKAYSREALEEYQEKHAAVLQQDGIAKFGTKMLAFRTELEVVDEYTVRAK